MFYRNGSFLLVYENQFMWQVFVNLIYTVEHLVLIEDSNLFL